jgi:TolA-binding protein
MSSLQRQIAMLALASACASAQPRPGGTADELKELRARIESQSVLVAQQQKRIEELEVKLAALSLKATAPAPSRSPAQAVPATHQRPDPRPQLKTVKLGEGRRFRRLDHINPVERAPLLPSSVELREPDDDALARLDVDPEVKHDFDADEAWAQAVGKLNQGNHAEAETELLAFVAAYPRHTAADNALYLAGLIRESRGDCSSALQLFESVPQRYPASDAVAQAKLERGRCLRILGRREDAKSALQQLTREHPDAPESAQGRSLLRDL